MCFFLQGKQWNIIEQVSLSYNFSDLDQIHRIWIFHPIWIMFKDPREILLAKQIEV